MDNVFSVDGTLVLDEVMDVEQAIAGINSVIGHIKTMEPAGNGLLENVCGLLGSAIEDLTDYSHFLTGANND